MKLPIMHFLLWSKYFPQCLILKQPQSGLGDQMLAYRYIQTDVYLCTFDSTFLDRRIKDSELNGQKYSPNLIVIFFMNVIRCSGIRYGAHPCLSLMVFLGGRQPT
jgi:hypothetical protein